jgi:hypothetical protein
MFKSNNQKSKEDIKWRRKKHHVNIFYFFFSLKRLMSSNEWHFLILDVRYVTKICRILYIEKVILVEGWCYLMKTKYVLFIMKSIEILIIYLQNNAGWMKSYLFYDNGL